MSIKRAAVVIGINYDASQSTSLTSEAPPRLRFAEIDAREVATRLKQEGFMVMLLVGDDATQDTIKNALRVQSNTTRSPGDLLVIYFAGHGALDPDDDDAAYLLPADTKMTDLLNWGITFTELLHCVRPAYDALIVLDCCHSGLILEGRGNAVLASEAAQFGQRVHRKTTAHKGLYVIASCAGGELAREDSYMEHGVFTGYALQFWDTSLGEVSAVRLVDHVDTMMEKRNQHRPIHGGVFQGRGVLRAAPILTSIDMTPLYKRGTVYPSGTSADILASHLVEWKAIHTNVQSLFVNMYSLRWRYVVRGSLTEKRVYMLEKYWIRECAPKAKKLIGVCINSSLIKLTAINNLCNKLIYRPNIIDYIRDYKPGVKDSFHELRNHMSELQEVLGEVLELADRAIVDIAELLT